MKYSYWGRGRKRMVELKKQKTLRTSLIKMIGRYERERTRENTREHERIRENNKSEKRGRRISKKLLKKTRNFFVMRRTLLRRIKTKCMFIYDEIIIDKDYRL